MSSDGPKEDGTVLEKQGLLEAAAAHQQDDKRWIYLQSVVDNVRPGYFKQGGNGGRLRRTAYMDGLRGFAAFLVYIMHHELWAHEAYEAERVFQSTFGYDRKYFFATLPIVRTFFTGGHFAVACFFILSGYVLSTKPIALIQAGDLLSLGDNLSSAFFRRWFRLYLPIIFMSLCIIILYHWFGILGIFIPEMTFGKDLWKWYCEFKNYTFLFGHSEPPWLTYHPHTWTIPAEMKGSVVVFCACAAFSRARQNARLACEAAMIFYFMYVVDGAWFSMFMTGMLLSDLDQLALSKKLPSWFYVEKVNEPYLYHFLFFFGLILGGVPSSITSMDYLRESPVWKNFAWMKPQAVYDFKWFFLYWAALFIVISVPKIPWLKRFFESRFCQYLGRISYMFYLVHGPVLWTLGDRIYAASGWSRQNHGLLIPGWPNRFPLPKAGPLGLEVAFVVPQLILLPITFWLAEIGTNVVDGPAIRFGAWLYKKTLETDEHQFP